ncbi:MAG: hypothetical protein QG621_543 [Patescibacteria group bacterium]|jgi:glycosyltransferase involved in cell wall biosynthesis|nr:hypothetical protein [Patescibacteria group bacterium]
MKVLVITGDKKFVPGNPRYDLQAGWVDAFVVVYWGKENTKPTIPEGAYDVITVQDPFWRGLFASRVAKRIGTQLNVQVHADISGQSLLKRLVAWVVLRRADTIRVVSEKIKKQVERTGTKAPITVLPVYVEISKVGAVVRRPHEHSTVLWVGRLEEEKNPLAALDIFKEVLKAKPDARLRMLGDGSLMEMVQARVRGVAAIELLGWQEDIVPFLETSDVLLCTSQHESWGASMVEALAAGVPVVAPDVGVAREAGAIVVEREKLAEAVVDVLEHHRAGTLFLHLPTAKEWALLWRESLLSSRVKA